LESARLPFAPVHAARARIALIAILVGLAALAWAVTGRRMEGMDAGPGTDLGGLGFYLTVWVVMMAAMMFPSIAPMVGVYSRLQETRRESGRSAPAGATAMFVAGYLVSWTLAGLIGYALFEIGRSIAPNVFSWGRGGPYLAGGVIVIAALYQLTPLKDACLTKCRGPLSFVIENWRDGRTGALEMGILHGAWCVGCCWALMAVLFALGVMSIGWMAFVAALIAAEKLLPWKVPANWSIAALLLVLGLAVAFAPTHVPGLTQPDSAKAMSSMDAMDGGGATQGDAMDGGGATHDDAMGSGGATHDDAMGAGAMGGN
jgi:predicted metal-binding membrane protein